MEPTTTLRVFLKLISWGALGGFILALASFVVISPSQNPLHSNPQVLFVLLGVFITTWVGGVFLEFFAGVEAGQRSSN